jgi:hypothetical protein
MRAQRCQAEVGMKTSDIRLRVFGHATLADSTGHPKLTPKGTAVFPKDTGKEPSERSLTWP